MQFPIFLGDIWIENPELTGKNEWPEKYSPVKVISAPHYDPYLQKVEFDIPVLVDGVYETRYKIIDFTPEELENRRQREFYLEQSQQNI